MKMLYCCRPELLLILHLAASSLVQAAFQPIVEYGDQLTPDAIQIWDSVKHQKQNLSGSGIQNPASDITVSFSAFGVAYNLEMQSIAKSKSFRLGDSYSAQSLAPTNRRSLSGGDESHKYEKVGFVANPTNCTYMGQSPSGAIVVLVDCEGEFLLTIVNDPDAEIDSSIQLVKHQGESNIKVKRNRGKGFDKALLLQQEEALEGDDDGISLHHHGRRLSADECELSPKKWVSLVIVNTPSRISTTGSVAATEADTLSWIAIGQVPYQNFHSDSGCNVQINLAGQIMYSDATTDPIPERYCNTINPFLSMVYQSQKSNSECCNSNNFEGCASGTTWCFEGGLPSIDFVNTPGCIGFVAGGWAEYGSITINYVSLDGSPTMESTSSTETDIDLFLQDLTTLFEKEQTTWASMFGDADAAQAWTALPFYTAGGLGWVGTICGQMATGVVDAIYPYGNGNSLLWTHELGHNLGLNHTNAGGIMDPYYGSPAFFDYVSAFVLDVFMRENYGVGSPRCLENNIATSSPSAPTAPTSSSRPPAIPSHNPTYPSPSPTMATPAPTFKLRRAKTPVPTTINPTTSTPTTTVKSGKKPKKG